MSLYGIFWGAIIVALPLYIRVIRIGVSARYSQDQFFCFVAILSIIMFGFRKSLLKVDCRFLLIAALFVILGYFNIYNFASYACNYQLIAFFCGLCAYSQFICNITSQDIKPIKIGLGIACVIQSLLVLISYFHIDLYQEVVKFIFNAETIKTNFRLGDYNYGNGSLLNSSISGLFISLTLPFLIKKPILFIIGFAALLFTSSLVPIVAFLAGGVVVYYSKVLKRRHFYKMAALCFGAFVSLIYLSLSAPGDHFFSANMRYKVWYNALTMPRGLSEIYGKGLGYFSDTYYKLFGGVVIFKQAHNEFIELYVAFGIIGLLAVFIYLYSNKDRILKGDTMFLWAFTASLASCFGTFTYHISATALVSLISLGVLLRNKEGFLYVKAMDGQSGN